MYIRAIRNDILKSKTITLTTVVFIAAAAMLVSLAAILVVNLAGSIDALMLRAKTPHFMQMHSGALDAERLTTFAEQNAAVDEFQVLEFLNVESARIVIGGKSLAGSVQDNGFMAQSQKFDYLLDLDGNVIEAADGEVYVPICYMQDGAARVGDQLEVFGRKWTVAGFLRDSQMNSLLASSKRFLLSATDYADIQKLGSVEYLIEFRLKDQADLGAFEAAYASANLNANGPTLTYPLFRTMNAISDGLMIAVILLISGLVVAIAFMCIRFTLLAKIEDDYREIGVMKAIGLRVADIKKLYIAKYAAIAALGCAGGFALSFVFRGALLENIRLYMGESEQASSALLFGVIGVALVFAAILAYVNGVLNRFKSISPAEAIRFGAAQEKFAVGRLLSLSRNWLPDTNVFLGVKDVLSRKKLYATLLAVLVLSAFIILVPQNLHHTIASNDFITYMGIGHCDLRIDIQQTERISEKVTEMVNAMAGDASIQKYVALTTKSIAVKLADGSEERIKVELGDPSVFPLNYSEGRAPAAQNEIALSGLNAKELDKKVGDGMVLVVNGEDRDFVVSGIYSDITNGGKTAKAIFTDDSADVMWSVIALELTDPTLAGEKAAEYADRFEFAKVSSIAEYIAQTFGGTIRSIGMASYAAIAIALTISMLVTVLFMKMLIAKDRYSIAVMKTFGFTNQDITAQYVTRSVFVLLVGIVLGSLLANTLGEALAGAVISSFGASSFKFVVNPFVAYGLSPLLMMGAVLLATLAGAMNAGRIRISEHIKE